MHIDVYFMSSELYRKQTNGCVFYFISGVKFDVRKQSDTLHDKTDIKNQTK